MSIPYQRVKLNGKVDLWDLGPQVAPKPPEAPEEPNKASFKHPADLAAAEIEFEDAIERYKDDLRSYTASRKAHAAWGRDMGGPVKVELWGVDARHAIDTEPARFKLDLPKGMKPGKAQADAEEMARLEADEIRQARSRDPMHAGAMQ